MTHDYVQPRIRRPSLAGCGLGRVYSACRIRRGFLAERQKPLWNKDLRRTPMYTPCPKSSVPQSRAPRSRREVKPPQQPHIVSFRLSPFEFEQFESHVESTGTNRSEFISPRRDVGGTRADELHRGDADGGPGIERDVFELRTAMAQQTELIKILAAASVGTAALLMNKEGSTLADNQRRVDKAIDLAITAAPQIIGRCLQLNPGLDGVGEFVSPVRRVEVGAPHYRSSGAKHKSAVTVTSAVEILR
jgi:hypothetical protein